MADDRHYDVVIIGTGAGGGTLGHRFASNGANVGQRQVLAAEPEVDGVVDAAGAIHLSINEKNNVEGLKRLRKKFHNMLSKLGMHPHHLLERSLYLHKSMPSARPHTRRAPSASAAIRPAALST